MKRAHLNTVTDYDLLYEISIYCDKRMAHEAQMNHMYIERMSFYLHFLQKAVY